MVIWLIGLSGSGKTTVGKEVFRIWKKKSPQTIFLDGDEVREIFSNENYSRDYTLKGRRLNAERISRLCLWLDNYKMSLNLEYKQALGFGANLIVNSYALRFGTSLFL